MIKGLLNCTLFIDEDTDNTADVGKGPIEKTGVVLIVFTVVDM